MARNGWRRLVVAAFVLLCVIGMSGAAPAGDPLGSPHTCATGRSGGLWQQTLDLDSDGKAAGQSAPSLCLDPTQVQEAGGCCTGHGGPAGCDAETHKVICADGKKSKSCSC